MKSTAGAREQASLSRSDPAVICSPLFSIGAQIAFCQCMLHWSIIFLVIAVIAGLLGFTGIAGAAMGIAKILFFVFLAIWLVVFLLIRKVV